MRRMRRSRVDLERVCLQLNWQKNTHLSDIWSVVSTPLKNISQLGWLFPIYGNMKNVPNHQPDIVHLSCRSYNPMAISVKIGYPKLKSWKKVHDLDFNSGLRQHVVTWCLPSATPTIPNFNWFQGLNPSKIRAHFAPRWFKTLAVTDGSPR